MTIIAKYRGQCSKCGREIKPGQKIEWERGAPSRHTACDGHAKSSAPTTGTIRVARGSGYGGQPYEVGSKFFDDDNRAHSHAVVVVRASKRYVREDGMSFGVGDEEGYIYCADCRLATDDERRELLDSRHAEALAEDRARRVVALKLEIDTTGEHPAGEHDPDGEVLFETGRDARFYGGGEWLVVCADYVWHVRNNGADGDDWRGNNISTGGAGAIGHRVPATPELLARIASLRAVRS
jgi:hypothetical protein